MKTSTHSLKMKTKTQYLVDQIPIDKVNDFLDLVSSFKKETGCRIRYKQDGRSNSPVQELPEEEL